MKQKNYSGSRIMFRAKLHPLANAIPALLLSMFLGAMIGAIVGIVITLTII